MTPKVGMLVYDRWWPWKVGRVTKVTKSTTHVLWISGGDKVIYDRPHQKFLAEYKVKRP